MQGAPDEKWNAINSALANGRRRLPGGSSLAQLLAEKRGVRNVRALPDLTIEQILKWADAHHRKTGEWPKQKSGEVPGARGQTWTSIDIALFRALRGLPGGTSLARLLAEKRGVRNEKAVSVLTIDQILKWADAHHKKTLHTTTANTPVYEDLDVNGNPKLKPRNETLAALKYKQLWVP